MSEALPGMPEAPPPAPPSGAAVAVLVRPGDSGTECFWLRRQPALAFAGGFYAFPGGRVDVSDATVGVVGAEGEDATLRAAAARELFEETGVLRARGDVPSTEASVAAVPVPEVPVAEVSVVEVLI